MSLSSSEVWQRIEREGLASGEQCRQWARLVVESLAAPERGHGLKVLQRLIELKKLTPYQAKILAGRSAQPLHLGGWLVWQRVPDLLWPDWLVVRPGSEATRAADSTSATASTLWTRRLNDAELAQLRAAAPSLPRALRLNSIEHAALQTTAPPELLEGQLLVFVAPIAGQLLSEKFASQTCSSELAFPIVRQVASGLAALHQQGIAHGRVLPDRIYWQTDRVVLAVDPLCAVTGSPTDEPAGLLGQSLGAMRCIQWLAPEFQVAGQVPTPSTDVYSLGCLWWWLLTGQPPMSGKSADEVWRQHLDSPPQLPAGCELSPEQWRCLQHTLGRNLSSRFPSAEALLRALDAADNPRPLGLQSASQAIDVVPIAQQARSSAISPHPSTPQQGTPQQGTPQQGTPQQGTPQQGTMPRVDATQPAMATPPSSTLAAGPPRVVLHRGKRRRSTPWLVPVIAGCGFLILLLTVLGLTGALQPGKTTAGGDRYRPSVEPSAVPANPASRDPRQAAFRIEEDNTELLWVPPSLPAPLPLELLPPGGQMFISFRPAELLDDSRPARGLLASFDQQLSPLLSHTAAWAGLPLEQIAHITAAFYPSPTAGGMPQVCLRVELVTPKTLSALKQAWLKQAGQSESTAEDVAAEDVGGQTLLKISEQRTYYITPQPLLDSQSIQRFSVGPINLMRDAVELRGVAGPLVPQLERLWSNSDQLADLSMFAAAPFLLTEGRGLIAAGPPRLAELLKSLLAGDLRGVGLQMRLQPQWYVEARFIGADALKAGKLLAEHQQTLRNLPGVVESQLVSHPPDPYWRAIALRFPHMLRTFAETTRFGVEHGTAIMNTYLPSEAAGNVLLASWIALHDLVRESPAAGAPANSTLTAGETAPHGIDEYLARPIRLSFEQEPIEVVLSLVAEEANDQLPSATLPMRFVLDGDAFEKAGITRNQQLRDFQLEGQAVRAALTEIAKRGNPVANVTDTRHADQRLLWVVAPDPEHAGHSMILLTTRTAAQAAGIELPAEFRP